MSFYLNDMEILKSLEKYVFKTEINFAVIEFIIFIHVLGVWHVYVRDFEPV